MAFPRVKVLEGELEGRLATSLEGRDYYSFQGIPYAEPPVGKLRFKPPVPKQPWTGIYDASKAGESSAQFDLVNRQYVGSEDCLFLNVFTPRLPCQEQEDELLPVMFFIHGGGFVNGSGNADQLGPDFIISKDTIMVTINYRLGVFGFLSLDIPEAPGNNGLKDQNLALKWVQKNIRAFNGDPDNITIFGISAGSASVEYHMLSPMSEGLFNKAILQSGSSLNPWARTRNPTKLVGKLTAKLGVSYEDPVECFKYLQNLDAEKLILTASISADDESVKDCEMFPFGPVVEKTFEGIDAFLTEEPLQLLMSGRFHHVPTITGFCDNEGNLMKLFYAKNIKAMGDRNFIDYLPSNFEVDRVHYDTRLRETYDYKDDAEAIDAFLSDLCFVGGIYQSLLFRLRNNHLENYMYMFTHDGKLNFIKQYFKISGKGAFHGDDTTYLGSNESMKDITPTDEDIKVRNRMVQMWTDFAKSGNPTPNESSLITTEWLPITSHHTILMEIGEDLKMNKLPFCERLSLWESIYSSSIIPY